MIIDELKNKLTEMFKPSFSNEELEFSISVFNQLTDFHLDEHSLTAGFLINTNLANLDIKNLIQRNFGAQTLKKIELLLRLSKISFPETQKQVANLRKQFIELVDDQSIIFIKIAERLTALKLAEKYDNPQLLKIAEECLYLYSPIAHRLGIRIIYQAMDDLAFKHLFPADYRRLYTAIEKRREQLERKLKDMSTDLKLNLFKNGIESEVTFRVKRLYSIFLKLKNKGVSLDDVFDLMALRVIVNKVEDCYFVLGITHSNWAPIEGRFRDWVTYPKPNGYRSIQTTVVTRKGDKFEIQIRTREMNREAEYGSAAHWAYKEGTSASGAQNIAGLTTETIAVTKDRWIARLKEFLENDEYFDNPYELQELLKSELKRDFIHILTPKGDIKTLRKDSTPVDFAYEIHTDLGSKVIGAKINGKLAKLKTSLKSGDVVEVITSKNAKPSRDWLNFVKTPKARSKILIWIKKHEKDQLIADGKRIWEKFKKQFRRKLQDNADDQSFKTNLVNIGFKSPEDFYAAISINSIKCSQTLLRKLFPDAFKKSVRTFLQDKTGIDLRGPKIRVEGMSGIETKLAKCCNPIKGEEIIAYVTQKSEMKIHSLNCKYIKLDSFESDRFKKAEWTEKDSIQIVRLKTYGNNYDNMLSYIVEEASNEKLELKSLERTNAGKNTICINLQLEVHDINQLKKYISKLHSCTYIDNVNVN